MNKQTLKALVALGVVTVSAAAAAAVDVTSVTAAVTDAGTAIATVGAAVLAMFVGGKAFKWIRSAL